MAGNSNAAAENILAKPNAPRPDFEQLASEMIKQLPRSISRQRAIGLAINSLIEMNDWHSHIDPADYLIGKPPLRIATLRLIPKNLITKIVKDMGREFLFLKLSTFLGFQCLP